MTSSTMNRLHASDLQAVPAARAAAPAPESGQPVGATGSDSLRSRIGPNAITRMAEALQQRLGDAPTRAVFAQAGLAHHLLQPPQHMVQEAEVRALHGAVRQLQGAGLAAELARDAGQRTAAYLLAHRIPRLFQALAKRLPARWAARLLVAAIGRHAWTFAGSGTFTAHFGGRDGGPASPALELRIQHNPLCKDLRSSEPCCDYYAATFQRLFGELVHARAKVTETHCEACGDDACRFAIDW